MSLSIWLGILVGCWALLSVVSGEHFRQKQEIDAAREKEEAARKAREESESEAS